MIADALRAYLRLFRFRINLRLAADKIRKHAERIQGKVLDVGAGNQPYRHLFGRVDDYVATNARRAYPEEDLSEIERYTDHWVEDADSLPFEDDTFDAVLSFQVLSVLSHPQRFFHESHRVLRPSGLMMITTDLLYPQWSQEDLMRHTEKHLVQMAKEVGFEILTVESFGGIYTALHCCLTRYILDYPQCVRSAPNAGAALFRSIALLIYLIMLPAFSLFGWPIYFWERNQVESFGVTVNTLMLCRKKTN